MIDDFVALKAELLKSSAIIIPESIQRDGEKNSMNTGVVYLIGPKVKDVKVGDKVAYIEGTYWKNDKRINNDEYSLEEADYIMIRESEIKFIIE